MPHKYIDHETHSFHSHHEDREAVKTVAEDLHSPETDIYLDGEYHPHYDYDIDRWHKKYLLFMPHLLLH